MKQPLRIGCYPMRVALASMLLVLGIMFPLLLSGQTFTNCLIGITCAAAAAVLCLGPALNARSAGATRWASRAIGVLGLSLAIALAAQIPSAYAFQKDFNRRSEAVRQERQDGEASLGNPTKLSAAAATRY